MVSRVLRLELRVEGVSTVSTDVRLVDPATGEKLLTPLEAQEARRCAESEVQRLRTELACLRLEGVNGW